MKRPQPEPVVIVERAIAPAASRARLVDLLYELLAPQIHSRRK